MDAAYIGVSVVKNRRRFQIKITTFRVQGVRALRFRKAYTQTTLGGPDQTSDASILSMSSSPFFFFFAPPPLEALECVGESCRYGFCQAGEKQGEIGKDKSASAFFFLASNPLGSQRDGLVVRSTYAEEKRACDRGSISEHPRCRAGFGGSPAPKQSDFFFFFFFPLLSLGSRTFASRLVLGLAKQQVLGPPFCEARERRVILVTSSAAAGQEGGRGGGAVQKPIGRGALPSLTSNPSDRSLYRLAFGPTPVLTIRSSRAPRVLVPAFFHPQQMHPAKKKRENGPVRSVGTRSSSQSENWRGHVLSPHTFFEGLVLLGVSKEESTEDKTKQKKKEKYYILKKSTPSNASRKAKMTGGRPFPIQGQIIARHGANQAREAASSAVFFSFFLFVADPVLPNVGFPILYPFPEDGDLIPVPRR